MIKVFLVEDESVIRDGLRENFPWEEYGFKLIGEAGDGEMALPLIRKTVPDVLITDIKMPFMDGLSLSKIVKAEFPKLHIIMISGYDDFDYARQAISVGAEQYLLKPITKLTLKKALLELKEKLDQEEGQNDYQTQYANDIREYEQFARRHFFEKIFAGKMEVKDIYDEAAKLSLNLTASSYNILFFTFKPKNKVAEFEETELFLRKQDELLHYFLRYPHFILFSWNVNSYGVLIKAEEGRMNELVESAVENITRICSPVEKNVIWHLAVSNPVERLSMLPECFQQANHLFAYRFIKPGQHVFDTDLLEGNEAAGEEERIVNVDPSQVDPERIKDFLSLGDEGEIDTFVENYLFSIRDALESKMFRNYVILNIRFAVIAFLEKMEINEAEYKDKMNLTIADMDMKKEEVKEYFTQMIRTAISIRDRESDNASVNILRTAQEYIDAHYMEESLSLNDVANRVGVSTNYLSSIFSRNTQKTFVEYITSKRMEKAKKLLKTTDISSGEISVMVGYKDPHYFSFVFKKTQGMSPREYRNSKSQK